MTESWNIVVGVDGSFKDDHATRWAGRTAAQGGGRVTVLYAARVPGARLPESELTELGRAVTEPTAEKLRAMFPDLPVATEVVAADPEVALVTASEDADLVVVGARGLGRISGRILGSVSQKVSAQAACPVVVVHGQPKHPGGDVTVGVDPADPIPEVLDLAFRLAVQREVGVHLLHVFAPAPAELGYTRIRNLMADVATERAAEMRTVVRSWEQRYPHVPVRISEVHGHPGDALTDAVEQAGTIVVGSRGRTGMSGRRLGSVAQRVLHVAPLAVVVPVAV